MIDDACVHWSLGLTSFASIVDNEWIEDRKFVDREFRITAVRQSKRFARQPFQRSVLSAMDDRICPKFIAQRTVGAKVVVGRNEVARVVHGQRVFAKAAWWLNHDENVAELQPGDINIVARAIHGSGRIAPGFDHPILIAKRKPIEPTLVPFSTEPGLRQCHLLFCEELDVVTAASDEHVDELIAEFGNLADRVSTLRQRTQDFDNARWSIQTDGSADAPLLIGEVRQHDDDTLIGIRYTPKLGV